MQSVLVLVVALLAALQMYRHMVHCATVAFIIGGTFYRRACRLSIVNKFLVRPFYRVGPNENLKMTVYFTISLMLFFQPNLFANKIRLFANKIHLFLSQIHLILNQIHLFAIQILIHPFPNRAIFFLNQIHLSTANSPIFLIQILHICYCRRRIKVEFDLIK